MVAKAAGAACSGRPSVAAIYSCGQASLEASGRRSDSFQPTGSVGCTAEGRWVQVPAHGTSGGPGYGRDPMDGRMDRGLLSDRLHSPGVRRVRRGLHPTPPSTCQGPTHHDPVRLQLQCSTRFREQKNPPLKNSRCGSTLATLLARTWKELLPENERDPFIYRTCGGHGGTRGQGGTPGGDNLPGLLSSGRLPGPSAWFRGRAAVLDLG